MVAHIEEFQGRSVSTIPVHISYEIIQLFSEGLYQSPHKAVEELVSNSYDAGAQHVHVLLPEDAEDQSAILPLWVIDDGSGMDPHGFMQLWRVADSAKASVTLEEADRPPIGQFGIGKLAAYVLAWRLTHVSRSDGQIHYTVMNYRSLQGRHQYEDPKPFAIDLYQLNEDEAKNFLRDIELRSPETWELLFGSQSSPTWTVAGLSDFKRLYDKLSAGRLRWVLSTGLPLESDFAIRLNSDELVSSKLTGPKITTYTVGGHDDPVAKSLDLSVSEGSIEIDGIDGPITGSATIFERRLTEGKSDQYGRSHGFFVKVRGRIINLEDELFGLDALNHAAWSRFSMTIEAEGLRKHLLSSREGVRESEPIYLLRDYLHGVFNSARVAYENFSEKEQQGIDIDTLLRDAPSAFVVEPIVETVRQSLSSQLESFYILLPQLGEGEDQDRWLESFRNSVSQRLIASVEFEKSGPNGRALRYRPDDQCLLVNTDHPFVDKLLAASKNQASTILFCSSELLLDALMHEHRLSRETNFAILENRDRVLRLISGDQPSTAREVLRLLEVANQDEQALERATGIAFMTLGFKYERRGGHEGGPDGVLHANLGRGERTLDSYSVVYDAKQTSSPAVQAGKVDFSQLNRHRTDEGADYAFFIADRYAGEEDDNSALNKKMKAAKDLGPLTLLKIDHVRRIIRLHYQYGVTLSALRTLFLDSRNIPTVEEWLDQFEHQLRHAEPSIPLDRLLEGLEEAKGDQKSRPNVYAVRANDETLKQFSPERLIAALTAVQTIAGERWIEVERGGNVTLHSGVDQILAKVDEQLGIMVATSTESTGQGDDP